MALDHDRLMCFNEKWYCIVIYIYEYSQGIRRWVTFFIHEYSNSDTEVENKHSWVNLRLLPGIEVVVPKILCY